ncbi:hypothetical protein [Campylobacter sp. MG1]|uniref:hypothetical protein n=1 Tax=Campylobacter sp. MG1 TaxID=2976332 RepID=UPI00226C9B73|nr:hypothetical protein [Campylobacter sp. MG1]
MQRDLIINTQRGQYKNTDYFIDSFLDYSIFGIEIKHNNLFLILKHCINFPYKIQQYKGIVKISYKIECNNITQRENTALKKIKILINQFRTNTKILL